MKTPNKIRRSPALCMALLLGLALCACAPQEPDQSLAFSTEDVLTEASGQTLTVTLQTEGQWEAEALASWCHVSPSSGSGAATLTLHVDPTDEVYERGSAIRVRCGENSLRLSVRQKGMHFALPGAEERLPFPKTASEYILQIETNMDWEVAIADTTGWLQVEPAAGNGSARLRFFAADNSYDKGRETQVTLRYGSHKAKLQAIQEGGFREDGHVIAHQENREIEQAFNLIFVGDGFTQEELIERQGLFDQAVARACEALWAIEPFKTFRDRFNVYSVAVQSQESGITVPGIQVKNALGTGLHYEGETPHLEVANRNAARNYASKVMGMTPELLNNQSVVIVLANTALYGGQTYWNTADYGALSVIPLYENPAYPDAFARIVQHEVGGHAIGKLMDDWNSGEELNAQSKAEIQVWTRKLYGSNIKFPTSAALIPYPKYTWGNFVGQKPEYDAVVACHDGGAGYKSSASLFICHSEAQCCMNDYRPYFSVGARYAIVQWVLFRNAEFAYSSAGMRALLALFLEKDVIEPVTDFQAWDLPHLPAPLGD